MMPRDEYLEMRDRQSEGGLSRDGFVQADADYDALLVEEQERADAHGILDECNCDACKSWRWSQSYEGDESGFSSEAERPVELIAADDDYLDRARIADGSDQTIDDGEQAA